MLGRILGPNKYFTHAQKFPGKNVDGVINHTLGQALNQCIKERKILDGFVEKHRISQEIDEINSLKKQVKHWQNEACKKHDLDNIKADKEWRLKLIEREKEKEYWRQEAINARKTIKQDKNIVAGVVTGVNAGDDIFPGTPVFVANPDVQKLTKKITHLEQQNKGHIDRIVELEKETDKFLTESNGRLAATMEYEARGNYVTQLRNEKVDLKDKLNETCDEVACLRIEIDHWKVIDTNSKGCIAKLKEQITELKDDTKRLCEGNSTLTADNIEFMNKNNNLRNRINKLEGIAKLYRELGELK